MFVNFFKWFVYKEDICIICIMYRAVGSASLLCDQIEFLDPRSQGQEIFWDFIILLDSSHDSWENEVLFVKIGARVLDVWLDLSRWRGPSQLALM